MKRKIFVLAIVVGMGMALYPLLGHAQIMGPGYGSGMGGNPGIGQNYGCGTGGGMMGYGYGNTPQYGPQYAPRYQEPQRPIDEKEAKVILENYLRSTKNPNLKLGKIEDKGSAFEGEIVTKKEGALVDRLAVDKSTGRLRSIY